MNASHKPEVSIITVTKNRAKLISRSINSVLNQTFKDFEYIIIDGASTDNTAEVVGSFKDDRIKYHKLKEDIRPLSLCFDYGVDLSLGNFISFLDDDDEYLPTKIEKQLSLLKSLSDEYGLVYCWMDYFDENNRKLLIKHHPANRGNIFHKSIEEQSMGGTPTLFLRRSVCQDVRWYVKDLKHVTDWEFNTRVSRKYLVDFVPEVLVNVYVNHQFLRVSDSSGIKTKENVTSLIEFSEYYLTEFKEGFKEHPKKKITHLVRLAKLYARLGESSKSRNIIMQLHSEFGFNLDLITTMLKTIYFFNFKKVR